MKKALVTGDAGFIGTHMRRALTDDGYLVVGVDKADKHDCRDFFDLCTSRFDLIVHCAAVVGGRQTIEGDPMAVAVDLELDAAMFRWAVATRQHRVVYFSSSAAYPTWMQRDFGPDVQRRRLCEDDIDFELAIGMPDMTYGWAKLSGEVLARYAAAEGVKVHVLRPFSGYGPGQSLDYPFPSFIDRALAEPHEFTVWGNGRQARDFVHVTDVIGCVRAVVDQDYREPLNIGTGRATTFDELAALVAPGVPIVHDESKPTGVSWRVADPTRMLDVYQPTVSIEQGVKEALNA